MSERTVTVAEAAAALGISEKAVRRRIERNVLPSVLGADKRRRVLASAVGLNGATPAAPPAGAAAPPTPAGAIAPPADWLDRLERLARENGQLRMIEEVAGRDREALLEARARIQQLEAQLTASARRGGWFRRRTT